MIKFLLLAYLLIALFIRIPDQLRAKQEIQDMQDSIQNVFDEMAVNDCLVLKESENIIRFGEETDRAQGYIGMAYKGMDFDSVCIEKKSNIYSIIKKSLAEETDIGRAAPLFISFTIYDESGDRSNSHIRGEIEFIYYEKLDKLYIWGEKGEMSWEEVEGYRDYLLHDIILGSYLELGKSRFSMGGLGEFELIDYLMPYEYCGMPEKELERVYDEEQGVAYTTWLDIGGMLCVQQDILRENIGLHGSVTMNDIPSMVTDEVFGRDTGCSRFAVQQDGKECELSDLVRIDDAFIGWMKSSGQAEGDLQRISPDRESGSRKTQQMLRECPPDKAKEALEGCEFYIEPGYLHIRFPYWDYEAGEPGFMRNGDSLWKGWLTMRTDDMERFLKVGKW